jgi:phosphoglycolate phosphatase-like HAD superfamily hydrolase
MWYFRAVAFDLDGTLAVHDMVSDDVMAAIDRARSDRAMLLVTGRTLDELHRGFPGLTGHFDAVVAENGAVMHTAAGTRLLSTPVDKTVDKALADRGVACSRGQVLLSIAGHDAGAATDVVTDLGLDCQVVHNRAAGMVLPAGVTKGSGLLAALSELGLSAHNAVAVGDAENDLALLHAAEVGVAVGNAIPALIEHADIVLDQPDGAGIIALLSGSLLAGHERYCPPRRWLRIGEFTDGTAALVRGSQGSILICGDTGGGKSYLAGTLAERWIDAGYSVLVIDPEGDHVGLATRPGVHLVDADEHLPSPSDLLAIMRPNHTSLVLDLSGVRSDVKLDYLQRLPAAIRAERARHGIPHWVIHDEAHETPWTADYPLGGFTVAEPGTCLITWRPAVLPAQVRQTIGQVLTVAPPTTGAHGTRPLRVTMQSSDGLSRTVMMDERTSTHVRHWHKYADSPLPSNRQFYFHSDGPQPGAAAATLAEFNRLLRHCDLSTLDYHLSRADFSRWIIGALSDQELGADLAGIERDLVSTHDAALERARQQILHAISRRYLTPRGGQATTSATRSCRRTP